MYLGISSRNFSTNSGLSGLGPTRLIIRKRIEYDIYYIENWTLGFDIKIIFMTFFTGSAPPKE